MGTRASERAPLPALTSLRFFAAFYVLVFHALEAGITNPVLRSFVGSGYTAVDFFFVLSGFVLAYKYCEADGTIIGTRRSFWAARFARVYPVYVLSLVVGAPLYLHQLRAAHSLNGTLVLAGVSAIAALLLSQSWIYRIAGSWNPPAWSLSVEAFLYFVFPFAVPRVVGSARRRARVVVVAMLWLAAIALPLVYVVTNPDGLHHVNSHSDGHVLLIIKYLPLLHVPSMLVGALAGWAYVHIEWRASRTLVTVAVLLIVAALVGGDLIPYPLLHNGLLAPLFAIVIGGAANSTGAIGRVLGHPRLTLLGDASYALYLLHHPLLNYYRELVGRHLTLLQFCAFAFFVQTLSIVVYKLVEVPARRSLRARLASR